MSPQRSDAEMSAKPAVLSLFFDALLRGYAQILFNRSLLVGGLLLLATMVSPRIGISGLLSILLATATAKLLELSDDLIESGLFSYNALLVGLGGSYLFEPGGRALLLLVVAVVASVFVTAALHSALGLTFNLPALTLPFLFVFYLLMAAAPALGVAFAPASAEVWALGLPRPLVVFLQSLGALFFLPRIDVGALVLLALLVYSRIALLLAILGFAIAQAMGIPLVEMPQSLMPVVLGYNFILTAIALGGVWFVPSPSSFLFAAAGVFFCGLVTIGLLPFLTWNGLPPLILPFNMTVLMLLYAMRQRVKDGRPKSVDFFMGTPEENLNYFRTRISRFGSHYLARFHAPFLGRWTCTQGVDGAETHQGAWRYAFDFEVAGPEGALHRGRGKDLSDYYCYRLPVLASADGTVAKVVKTVKDNPLGETNLKENWGNLVLIYHGPGLYSMVCHLSPGTSKVREGQFVRRGDQLGLCGNSGRSPVPHLHWQLQATERIGAPTLYAELHDVLSEGDTALFHRTFVPCKGDVVRNLEPQEEIGRLLRFGYGESFVLKRDDGVLEEITPDIDLQGNLLLRARDGRDMLYYQHEPTHFTVFDTLARRRSALHLIHAGLSRLPFEVVETLKWDDVLPRRSLMPWWLLPLWDLVAPFFPGSGIEMCYEARREGERVIVSGRSKQPPLTTEATLRRGVGVERVTLTYAGKTRSVTRVADEESPEDKEPKDGSQSR
ncbi:MAG: urea transporter [Deltaproteobacteria bacterium]|nr:urea transporter [Deltaproteobacteria bacterium]